MNKIPALFCGLLMALPVTLRAQQQLYKIDKVTPAIIQTPIFQYQGDQRQNPYQIGKWLEIEVQFESAAEYTDEITVRYFVMINKAVLSGEVTHVNVAKGRELYSVMYVPPQTMLRLLVGRPVTINSVDGVGVQLVVKGQIVYEMNNRPDFAAQWWQSLQQTPGLMLNKNETPFAPLYWDRYQQIKPSEH